MNNKLFSYKVIPTDSIIVNWNVYGRTAKDGTEIKQWKKNKDLNIDISIFLNNKKQVLESIPQDSSVSVFVYFESLTSSYGTGLHNVVKQQPFIFNSNDEIDINNIIINGGKLAGSVKMTVCIALTASIGNLKSTVFATEKGAILFENSIVLHLEGTQALFPVKAIDFSKLNNISAHALYYLVNNYSQLDSNFNTAYTLFFNTKHPLFKKINADTEEDSEVQYIIRLIMYDVYKTIVEDALNNDSFDELDNFSGDDTQDIFSLRSVYSRIINELIEKNFQGKNLKYLKELSKKSNTEKKELITAIQSYILGE